MGFWHTLLIIRQVRARCVHASHGINQVQHASLTFQQPKYALANEVPEICAGQ